MKLFFLDCGTRDVTASIGLLFLRITIGLMMFFGHGLAKLQNFHQTLEKGWPIPAIWPLSHMTMSLSLISTIVAEMGAAALIILGLATRPAAFVLGFAMTVAAFQVQANAPFFGASPMAKEPAILYLIPCFVLIITGAGLFSFDNPLSRDKRRRRG
ncbi:MAG: DoxX family protein [Akkermansiaceae bacterium]|nr:DoxX family protein [Akkermansiaceae bacterium]